MQSRTTVIQYERVIRFDVDYHDEIRRIAALPVQEIIDVPVEPDWFSDYMEVMNVSAGSEAGEI